MAGHSGGPAALVERWRQVYWRRLEDAKSGEERLAAAFDHLRTALAKCCTTPEQRQRIINTTTTELAATAEDLFTGFERGRTRG
jgi:hypothetical protein